MMSNAMEFIRSGRFNVIRAVWGRGRSTSTKPESRFISARYRVR